VKTRVKWNGDWINVEWKVDFERPETDFTGSKMKSSLFHVALRDVDTGEKFETDMTASELEALKNGTLVW